MSASNKIVVTGAKGQLGRSLQLKWPGFGLAENTELVCLDSRALDITDRATVFSVLQEINGASELVAVINAAAYTAVDKAESESERAYKVNEAGAANLADYCQDQDIQLVQLSTDFVFDGSTNEAYGTDHKTNPLGIYGASKLAGEKAVLSRAAEQALVIRTSWLYSPFGSNFVKTMLRLMAERDELSVVADQTGSPTATFSLVECLFAALSTPQESGRKTGIYHWSDTGAISWYDFARAIQEEALELGLLKKSIPVHAIKTEQYPTPARRPAFSVLDSATSCRDFNIEQTPWRENLRRVLEYLLTAGENP